MGYVEPFFVISVYPQSSAEIAPENLSMWLKQQQLQGFMGILDPRLHLLWINVSLLEVREQKRIQYSHLCDLITIILTAAQSCSFTLAFLWTHLCCTDVIKAVSTEAMILKYGGPSDTPTSYLQNTKCWVLPRCTYSAVLLFQPILLQHTDGC